MLSEAELKYEVTALFDKLDGDPRAIPMITQYLRARYSVAVTVFTLIDVEDQVGRELTDEEKEKVTNSWYWYKGLEDMMVSAGFGIMDDLLIDCGIEREEEQD
jgi:hypothetical protein